MLVMTHIILFIADAILINVGFLASFSIRYGLSVPEGSFFPYRYSFAFLTLIYIFALFFSGVYKKRFRSSWDLFTRTVSGLFLGTLLGIAFVYVFRMRWGAFPTSVFIISFFINLFLVFKINQLILKSAKKIKKQVIVIGGGKVDDTIGRRARIERKQICQIRDLLLYHDIDEIVVSETITDAKDLNLLLYLSQRLKAEILFSPSVYMDLLPERINGNSTISLLSTFVGRRSDLDEFLIRLFDIISSLVILLVLLPWMFLIALLIKTSSPGPVIYRQQRAGKDGNVFTLYKFRTMINDAEKISGFLPATENDPRITKPGVWLRRIRFDELPQLFNILLGDMSLVGPRPENLCRVGEHKALRGLRLAVKPGLTGLAQIRSFYDLHPQQKIKYDYLYIQRRSLLLNLYILAKTIPVIFSKKGW
jgi:lipopolysaccharide/colanic/teichoic acid biosynthesis glycosyltransferase